MMMMMMMIPCSWRQDQVGLQAPRGTYKESVGFPPVIKLIMMIMVMAMMMMLIPDMILMVVVTVVVMVITMMVLIMSIMMMNTRGSVDCQPVMIVAMIVAVVLMIVTVMVMVMVMVMVRLMVMLMLTHSILSKAKKRPIVKFCPRFIFNVATAFVHSYFLLNKMCHNVF